MCQVLLYLYYVKIQLKTYDFKFIYRDNARSEDTFPEHENYAIWQ